LIKPSESERPELDYQTKQFVKSENNTKPDVDRFGVVERLANNDSDTYKKVKCWLL
jgi:hypothetical protein